MSLKDEKYIVTPSAVSRARNAVRANRRIFANKKISRPAVELLTGVRSGLMIYLDEREPKSRTIIDAAFAAHEARDYTRMPSWMPGLYHQEVVRFVHQQVAGGSFMHEWYSPSTEIGKPIEDDEPDDDYLGRLIWHELPSGTLALCNLLAMDRPTDMVAWKNFRMVQNEDRRNEIRTLVKTTTRDFAAVMGFDQGVLIERRDQHFSWAEIVPFEEVAERLPYRYFSHPDREEGVIQFTCQECAATVDIPSWGVQHPGYACAVVEKHRHWRANHTTVLCPDCKEQHDSKDDIIMANGNPNLETIAAIPKEKRRAIRDCLIEYFDEVNGVYHKKDDEGIAQELQVPVKWVIAFREENHGHLAPVVKNQKEIREMLEQLGDLTRRADDFALDKMEATFKEQVERAAGTLLTKLLSDGSMEQTLRRLIQDHVDGIYRETEKRHEQFTSELNNVRNRLEALKM